MRLPVTIVALLLLGLPCAAQQSQNSGQSQTSSPAQNQNQPDKNSPPAKRTTADDNPFPEEESKKAAAGNPAPDAPAPKPSSDTGKSPGSGDRNNAPPASTDSSSRTGLRSLDDDSPESRISDGAGGYIYSPKLAAQDTKVGGFYLDTGDYKGAYARFKEATKVDPGNADAVFGLAEAARALKMNNEAADNYRIYLDAVPSGSKAKAARKALAGLGEPPKK
ncbi:MAG TPA: tetratricopeptide repeat protein [Silvibacterium sp.]|nr:tetratricopeptide repeat protein [Silvibacterium sp.]